MNQEWMIHVSEWTLLIVAAMGMIIVLAAMIYDFRLIRRRQLLTQCVKRLRKPTQPHVSVLIYAENNEADLRACLDSVSRSRYRNYDIVVVDNHSLDATRRVAKNFQRRHARLPFYYYRSRQAGEYQAVLRNGYQKSQQGELVLILTATQSLAPYFIKRAVAQFVTTSTLTVLVFNSFNPEIISIGSMLQRFWQLSYHILQKNLSLVPFFATKRVMLGSMVRREVLLVRNKKRISIQYAADLTLVDTAGVTPTPKARQLRSRFLSRLIVMMLFEMGVLFIVGVLTYAMITAASLQSSSLLVASWSIVSIWLLVTVWSDEASGAGVKIGLSFCIPVMYFALYSGLVVMTLRGISRSAARVRITWRAPMRFFMSKPILNNK